MKKPTIWSKNFILVFIINIFTSVSFHMLSPTLPQYVLKLGFSDSVAGIVASAFVISSLLVRPAAGPLCDSVNTLKLMSVSLGLILVSIVGYSFGQTPGVIIAFRLIHGLGWGIATTANSTLAAMSLPEDMMGEGIGVFGLASVISTAIAPNLGLYLSGAFGFQAMFLFACAFPLTGLLLSFFVKASTPKRTGPRVRGIHSIIAVPCLIPALVVLFVGIVVSSVSTFLAVYAGSIGVKGIGVFFTVYACALFVSKPLSGKLSDRIDRSAIVYPGLALLAAVFILFRFAGALWVFLVAAVLYGFGYGGLQPMLQAWAVRAVVPERRGVANSTFFIGMDVGTGLGSLVAGFAAERMGYANMYTLMLVPILLAALVYSAQLLVDKRRKNI